MKIGIDIFSLISKKKTGINWYAYHLIKNLQKIDKENFYILFASSIRGYIRKPYIKRNFEKENFHVSILFFPQFPPVYNDLFLAPIKLFSSKFDIFHWLNISSNKFIKSKKQIVTIHDLTPLINHFWFVNHHYKEFKYNIIRIVKRVDKIITVSYNTKNDLIKLLNICPEKIHVIYEGVGDNFRVIDDKTKINEIKKKYNIHKNYLLCVGTIEPRKNHIRLLNTFVKLKERLKDYQLVICGKAGWKTEVFFERLKEIPENIRKDIIITDYVSYEDLPLLYNGCDIFIYPSLYEGFGLPILEAMRCGVPVITSNVSSMPEVAGDAAILVNPEDEEEIGAAIIKLLDDRELRDKLIKKGLERSKIFTWENTARQTLKVYKELH